MEQAPVGHVGEAVIEGVVFDQGLGLFTLGDILHGADDARRLTVFIEGDLGLAMHMVFAAIGADDAIVQCATGKLAIQ